MGFLDDILRRVRGKKEPEHIVAAEESEEISLEEIWMQEDSSRFVVEMGDYIMKKCGCGENLSMLSEAELIFYITQSVERDVNSDGFQHVLFYAEDECIGRIEEAFDTIGAPKTAEICRRALSAYGQPLPRDMTERQELITEMEDAGCDEADSILSECDDAFYLYEENLNALNHAYVLKNKAYFA